MAATWGWLARAMLPGHRTPPYPPFVIARGDGDVEWKPGQPSSSSPQARPPWGTSRIRKQAAGHKTSSPPLGPGTVHGVAAQLFLDPQELVVLGDAVGPTGRAGLDLAGVGGHGDVGDCRVFGLAGAMADYRGEPGAMGHLDGLQGFGQGANLVDLDQDAVGAALGNASRQAFGVGHEEVVANNLGLASQRLGEGRVTGPVVLVERVLDRDDGILVNPCREKVNHLLAREDLVGCRFPELVALLISLVEQFGAGAVEGDGDVLVAAGGVAGLADGVENEGDRFLVVEVGREPAFIANVGIVAGLLEH